MREIDTIVIHCSATEYGNTELFREWHLGLGWDDIGYHYVITNSYPSKKSYDDKKPEFTSDGVLEVGRSIHINGAHVRNHNEGSVGICLVGDRTFTRAQFETLKTTVKMIKSIYNIKEIHAHYEYDTAIEQGKTCPNMEIEYLINLLNEN